MSYLHDPYFVLGAPESANDEQLRAAYIQAVRRHPPEQSPDSFARISEAYEQIRTEAKRLRFRFVGPFPHTWEEARDMVPPDADLRLPKREEWLAELILARAVQAAERIPPEMGAEA